MPLKFTTDAEADLEEIALFIEADNPSRARSFLAELKTHCELLGENPMIRITAPEIGEDVRRSVFGNYNINYFPNGDDVVIFGIIEGHRKQALALRGRL